MVLRNIDEVMKDLSARLLGAVDAFKKDLQKLRTGKASTGLVDGIQVDLYGSKMSLSHLAQITTPENHLIVIQPFDAGSVSAIEKAIQSSGLGLNPAKDGAVLRVSVPPPTEERRKEIVKHLHKVAEDFRVSMRGYRKDANDAVKSLEKGGVPKDEAKRALDAIQKRVDEHIAKIDTLLADKEKEVLKV